MSIISPSPFVSDWVRRLRPATGERSRALDVAMGQGRHAVLLAEAGFLTFGVDRRLDALQEAKSTAHARGLPVRAWCADLTQHPLPRERFDLIIVTRYLQRDLFAAIRDAIKVGGVVVYETFTTAQRLHGVGPTSPDHLLEPGELRRAFESFDILAYEEVQEPEAVARVAARRK